METNFSDKNTVDQLIYILLAIGTFFGFLLKFVGSYIWKNWKKINAFINSTSNEEISESLLQSVQNLKKTIKIQTEQLREQKEKLQFQSDQLLQQSRHIEHIEEILKEFEEVLNSLRNLKNHRAIKYIEAVTISLGFVDSMRPESEDHCYEFLEEVEKILRQMPFAGKKISLNFLNTNAINSHGTAAIARYFSKVSHEDYFRLKVIFNDNRQFDKLAKNLNSLRATTGSDNTQVIVVNS